MTDWKPNILCLGSGGTKGVAQVGALYYADINGYLDNIEIYIGCSVGAILNTLLLIGYTPIGILQHSLNTVIFRDLNDIKWTQIIHEYGIVPNSVFEDELAKKMEELIVKKLGKIPTLKELYKITKKRIIYTVTSMVKDDDEALYMDHDTNPDISLMTVLRATSNSPIIFGKLEHQKDLLGDGALNDPFPINYLDDGRNQIFGICVKDDFSKKVEDVTFLNYIVRATGIPLKKIIRLQINAASENCKVLWLSVKDITMFDTGKNYMKRLEMFKRGYKDAERFFVNPVAFTGSSPARKVNKDLPISKDVIKTCLGSHGVRMLFKCLEENPTLLRECLQEEGLDMNFRFKKDIVKNENENDVKEENENDVKEENEKERSEIEVMVENENDVIGAENEKEIIEEVENDVIDVIEEIIGELKKTKSRNQTSQHKEIIKVNQTSQHKEIIKVKETKSNKSVVGKLKKAKSSNQTSKHKVKDTEDEESMQMIEIPRPELDFSDFGDIRNKLPLNFRTVFDEIISGASTGDFKEQLEEEIYNLRRILQGDFQGDFQIGTPHSIMRGGFGIHFGMDIDPRMMQEILQTSAMMMENIIPFFNMFGQGVPRQFELPDSNIRSIKKKKKKKKKQKSRKIYIK